jgi:hypothetical protein
MAYADPQSLTIAGVATSLPRIGSGPTGGTFQSNDGNVRLSVNHSNGKRFRRILRVDHQKIAADPVNVNQNTAYSMSAYLVVDVPKVGYTVAQQKEIVDALTAYLTASTGAKVTQLLGAES